MDVLSFALYHENTKVIGEDTNEPALEEKKRQREEPEVTDSSDVEENNDAQRQRVEEGGTEASSSSAPQGQDTLAELKAAVYAEVTRSLEDSIAIDDICTSVEDRALVSQAVQSLEEDGRIMQSDGEVYLID